MNKICQRFAVVISILVVIATTSCSREAPEHAQTSETSAQEHDETLPLPLRLAFMTGHVEAGLALYRAGEPEMAAPHLLHPVSETHASEREGLDAYGFDATLFEDVSIALDQGRPASEIEPQLTAAEENLALIATRADGDTRQIVNFLLDKIVEEYEIAVTDGVISDPGEYQDAYGFAIVARDRLATKHAANDTVMSGMSDLINLWPDAPIPPAEPASVDEVEAKVARVRKMLD